MQIFLTTKTKQKSINVGEFNDRHLLNYTLQFRINRVTLDKLDFSAIGE